MKKISMIFAIAVIAMSCKDTADKAGVIEDTRQATIDSMQIEMAKKEAEIARQKSIDSVKAVAAREQKAQPVVIHNTTTAATPEERKRKGWNGAAKGAAIGAGVGAITGAVVSKKNKGAGAVIGGVAGAGVGAGTGAILDAEKKKREEGK